MMRPIYLILEDTTDNVGHYYQLCGLLTHRYKMVIRSGQNLRILEVDPEVRCGLVAGIRPSTPLRFELDAEGGALLPGPEELGAALDANRWTPTAVELARVLRVIVGRPVEG